MSPLAYEVRDGKARYDDRTLAEWVPEIVQRLAEQFAPSRIVLFGSVARGDDERDSDVDLLVVLPELRLRHHDAAVSMLRSLRDLPVPVQVFVTDRRECERRHDVIGSMHYWPLREGRVVYARAA